MDNIIFRNRDCIVSAMGIANRLNAITLDMRKTTPISTPPDHPYKASIILAPLDMLSYPAIQFIGKSIYTGHALNPPHTDLVNYALSRQLRAMEGYPDLPDLTLREVATALYGDGGAAYDEWEDYQTLSFDADTLEVSYTTGNRNYHIAALEALQDPVAIAYAAHLCSPVPVTADDLEPDAIDIINSLHADEELPIAAPASIAAIQADYHGHLWDLDTNAWVPKPEHAPAECPQCGGGRPVVTIDDDTYTCHRCCPINLPQPNAQISRAYTDYNAYMLGDTAIIPTTYNYNSNRIPILFHAPYTEAMDNIFTFGEFNAPLITNHGILRNQPVNPLHDLLSLVPEFVDHLPPIPKEDPETGTPVTITIDPRL